MLNNKYQILMFNMSYWQQFKAEIRNRNYFILQELLKRSEVKKIIAVDYLPVDLKLKIKSLKKGIWYNQCHQINKKLTVCSIIKIKKIDKYLEQVLFSGSFFLNCKLIIWSYFPLYIGYFDFFKADLTVFDAVDNWLAHPSYKKKRQKLQTNYQKIKQKTDLIFTVSKDLKNQLFANRKNVFYIPNGVNIKIKEKNKKNQQIIIGYVGTIQSRVDFNLINQVIKNHLDKKFIFVGPVWPDAEISKIKKFKNVHFTGRVPYSKLPDYLSQFDIGIIPHKINQLTCSMNPMKFYEYLAFGLPIIATQQIIKNPNLLYYAKSAEQFSKLINKALAENSQKLINKRKKFAKKKSWTQKVNRMMQIINQNVK